MCDLSVSYVLLLVYGSILIKESFVSCIDIMMTSPDISIGGWMDSDFDSREWHTNSSPPLGRSPYPDAIVVPSSVRGMSLVCNASYPVEWRFHRERWGGRRRLQFALRTTRISDGLDVIRFSSELSFFSFDSNSLTGNYTCQKVGYPRLSQSLYVFWEGGSPPYLTLARSYRRPPRIPFRQNDSSSFVLPCTVSLPSMVPQLIKEEGISEQQIKLNKSVEYDPRRGFTMSNLQYPYGRYTCSAIDAEEGDGDTITFNVVDEDDEPKGEFNETIRHGAFYNINSTSRELTCCSAGQDPPKLKLVECDHPTICAIAKHTLHTMESAKKRKAGCSIIALRGLRAGIFRCVGAGIDVVREFFYPMPDTLRFTAPPPPKSKGGTSKGDLRWGGKSKSENRNRTEDESGSQLATPAGPQAVDEPYFDWNEADEKKMMLVTKLSDPLYVGQNKTFSCRVSHYYFAQGIVWGIVYANQSEVYLNGREPERKRNAPLGGIRHFDIIFGKNQQLLDFAITDDLQNITCFAPIWNSTEWGKKSISFVVKRPTEPTLVGKLRKDFTWYLNDTKKTLECHFTGEPVPKVVWKKDNHTFALNTNTTNDTSVVTFPRVTLDMEGIFQCLVSNEAGTTIKTFRITVLHATSTTVSAVLVLSIVGFVIVSIIATLMFQYLKSQNTVINRLTSLAFKDVTSNGTESRPGVRDDPLDRSSIPVDSNGVVLPPLSFSSPLPHHSASPSPAPTAVVRTPSPEPSAGQTNDIEIESGYSNGSFAFGYANNKNSTLEVRRSSSPTPPPLSSFSSYHKF